MPYVTATGLITQYSAEEIAQRADRGIPRLVTGELLTKAATGQDITDYSIDEQAAVTQALELIESKLLDAESMVNGFLASRYSIPLATVPRLVVTILCDVARYQLYDDLATETIKNKYDAAVKMLQAIAGGKVNLGVDPAGNKPETSDVATVSSETPVWRRDGSKGFM
jgi:phage gp36-like protein